MSSQLKVSCVMPTYNREKYVPMAIRCFFQQTYENKELIIVDDGTLYQSGLVGQLTGCDDRVMVIHLDERTPTGTKRNIGAESAQGEVIVNWDDDDFSASYRLQDQVGRLLMTRKAVTGYNSTVVYDEATGLFYKNMGGPPYFASGTSQCYMKSWWDLHPFPDCSFGEDSVFARTARLADELSIADVGKTMVARKHANNTDHVYIQKLRKLTPQDISLEFFSTMTDRFIPAHEIEAKLQFASPIIDKDYRVSHLPEVATR